MKLDLPKTASYWPRNEETIRFMCDRYNVKPKSLTRYPDLPWEERYEKYMQMITGHSPCPVCNGPMKFIKKHEHERVYGYGIACEDHPHHTYSLIVAWYPVEFAKKEAKRRGETMTPEQIDELYAKAVANNLGQVCTEHGEFLWDCDICSTRVRERAAEEIDIAVGMEASKEHENIKIPIEEIALPSL